MSSSYHTRHDKSRDSLGDALKNIFAGAVLAPALFFGAGALHQAIPDAEKRLETLTKFYETPCRIHVQAQHTAAGIRDNPYLVEDCAQDSAFNALKKETHDRRNMDMALAVGGDISYAASVLASLVLMFNTLVAPVRLANTALLRRRLSRLDV